ncbi:hypothetical protein BKA57DRAFT_531197 [Linnemannia elongata]|nr:hypothetical protein BKA57DRAFT_531197 [Linnemannia elongata]
MHHMKEEVIGKKGAIGESMESMSVFLPRSSLYEIHRTFFKTEKRLFEKEMTRCFANMFSTPEIRMRSAAWEICMYVYLDAFVDIHRANSPDFGETWCPHIIYSVLEKVYKGIRCELSEKGLLTNEAAGEYLMRTEPKAT